jgi:hypothetical protein
MTTTLSIKTSAAKYASFWQWSEHAFVRDISASNKTIRLGALVGAAGYFKVARSFALAHDVHRGLPRLAPVLSILDEYRSPELIEDELVPIVTEVRRRLASAYNMNDLLSAATKFLWLVHRHPVVIYDGNVRDSLGAPTGDYSAYLARWYERYSEFEDEIRIETAALAKRLSIPAETEWFRRRVFDIHVWSSGGTNA